MAGVQTPIIPTVAHWIATNPGTISLGQGVVFYPPPPSLHRGLEKFGLDPLNHRYNSVAGLPELLEQVRTKLEFENSTKITQDRAILVSAGSNMSLINILFAITDPGDEVILLSPYYFNHEMAIQMLGCKPVAIPTQPDFQPDLEQLTSAITSRTRAIVTVSPNNPTGAVYPEITLRQINTLCREFGIFHISDEAYEYFVHGNTPHFSPSSIEGSSPYTLTLHSLSKSYGFASWRIGYSVVPIFLMEALIKVQDTQLICAPVVSQFAAVEALKTGPSYCRSQMEIIRENRNILISELSKLEGRCKIPTAEGAFYILLRLDTRLDSVEVARRLVAEFKVAVIPGIAFGIKSECLLRIGYAALEPSATREAASRLVSGLSHILGY